jgi:hypothetical protein
VVVPVVVPVLDVLLPVEEVLPGVVVPGLILLGVEVLPGDVVLPGVVVLPDPVVLPGVVVLPDDVVLSGDVVLLDVELLVVGEPFVVGDAVEFGVDGEDVVGQSVCAVRPWRCLLAEVVPD